MAGSPLRAMTASSAPANADAADGALVRSPQTNSNSNSASGQSFAQRKATRSRAPNSNIVEGDSMMRSITRPPPGDASSRRKAQTHPEVAKKKSAYFENEFSAPNRSADPVQDRVQNEAMVMAELKTNVIITDEFSFITDLSYHLSNRYHRPISSIAVTLNHGCCMLFGGSFEAAYTLTIHALPDLVQPATNRRNTALIQRHLQESLGAVPARGWIHFVPTPEENVAIGGKTVGADIEEQSRGTATEQKHGGVSRRASKPDRKLSVKSFGNFRSPSTAPVEMTDRIPTPAPSTSGETTRIETIPEIPPTPPEEEDTLGDLVERKPEKAVKQASRRRSLRFALFGGGKT
ncbi:Tautomerase/MIF [Xylariomycetidae sp. FL0641]|nr:Tautomerase/MIF [Xylariomycetidae sp. FL0641]